MSITLKYDPNNPGEVLACLGVFELIDKLYNGVHACFDRNTFYLDKGELSELISHIKTCEISESNSYYSGNNKAVLFGEPFNIVIDWYNDFFGGPCFKNWAGQQRALKITKDMRSGMSNIDVGDLDIFQYYSSCGSSYCFDSNIGTMFNSIDSGFSFDKLSDKKETRILRDSRPMVELLAFISLQRFRPLESSHNTFKYILWEDYLPIELAPMAMNGMLDSYKGSKFYFTSKKSSQYYSYFSQSFSGDML